LNYKEYTEGDTLSLQFSENKDILSKDKNKPGFFGATNIIVPIAEIADSIACIDNLFFF